MSEISEEVLETLELFLDALRELGWLPTCTTRNGLLFGVSIRGEVGMLLESVFGARGTVPF